jgi:glycosyltransferase involved in cell wall biosynthesis
MVLEGWHSGGTEQYVLRLLQYLRRQTGFAVSVALLGTADHSLLPELRAAAAEVFLIDRRGAARLAGLRKIVRQARPDVCHLHLYTSLLPATLVLRALGVPRLLATLHMPLNAWNWRHRTAWRLAVGMVDRVICNSSAVADSIGRSAVQGPSPPSIIPPPLATLSVARADSRPTSGAPFTACGCGRLAPEKDWPTLLRAFAALRGHVGGAARLIHLGDGQLRESLHELACELGIAGDVEWRGTIAHEEVLGTLATADVFVLPSRFEGLGMAAVEAMQCGVPTITADFASSYDLLDHGRTGHRFSCGDWQELYRLLLWHYRNRQASRDMGRRGRESVMETFSEEKTLGLHLQLYRQDPGAAA